MAGGPSTGVLAESRVRAGRVRFDGGVSTESVLQARRPWIMAASVLLPLVLCAVLVPFRGSMAHTNAALALVLLVVAAASSGIRSAGYLAALSSAVWFDFFLTQPYHRLTITGGRDIQTTVLLVLVGAAVTEIALWGRRQQAQASREQGYLDGIVTTGATVAAGHVSTASLIEHVAGQIAEVLTIDGCRFDEGRTAGDRTAGDRTAGDRPALEDDGTVTRNKRQVDVDRLGLPTDSEIELAVRSGGVVRGHYLLTAATRVARPTLEQRRVAVALANQVGAALASPPSALDD